MNCTTPDRTELRIAGLRKTLYPTGLNRKEPHGKLALRLMRRLEKLQDIMLAENEERNREIASEDDAARLLESIRELANLGPRLRRGTRSVSGWLGNF